ncbi:MAG: AsmA-like C-terminal domain-containing protein [Pseudomonadota bacterium]
MSKTPERKSPPIGLILLEGLGLVLAVVIVAAALFLWRVNSGPVSLTWATPVFERLARSTSPAFEDLEIGEIEIARTEERDGYLIDLRDVAILDEGGETIAGVPHVALAFATKDFWSRRFGPRTIILDAPRVRIIRRADLHLGLDYGQSDEDAQGNLFRTMTGGEYFRDAFEEVSLRNAKVEFLDENSGRQWSTTAAQASISRTEKGYSAILNSDFDLEGQTATVRFDADYDLQTDLINANVDYVDAPISDLLAVFFASNAQFYSGALSGQANLLISSDGIVQKSSLTGSGEAGALNLGALSTSVSGLSFDAEFDPSLNRFDVREAVLNADDLAVDLSGTINLLEREGRPGSVRALGFDLSGPSISAVLPSMADPLTIDEIHLSGEYDIDQRRVSLRRLDGAFLNGPLSATLSATLTAKGPPEIAGMINVGARISKRSLMGVWPEGVAWAARKFISERVTQGVFHSVRADLNISPETLGPDGALSNDALALSFSVVGGNVTYAPGMDPIEDLVGSGVLRGNRFDLKASSARVGDVDLTRGDVEIGQLRPKGYPARFSFDVKGDAGEILRILNDPPLKVLSYTEFTPDQFSGEGTVRAEVFRPNQRDVPRSDYRYSATAEFPSLTVEDFFRDVTIPDAQTTVSVETNGMQIDAVSNVAGTPIDIEWNQKFGGKGDTTSFSIAGVLSPTSGDAFGIPTRQFLRGDTPFRLAASGNMATVRTLTLEADLDNSVLLIDQFDWIKPAGISAKARIDYKLENGRSVIDGLNIVGDGMSIVGRAAFDSELRLLSANLSELRLAGAADLSVGVHRDSDGRIHTSLTGAYLRAGGFIEQFFRMGQTGGNNPFARPDPGAPFPFAGWTALARIDRLDLRNDIQYKDLALDLRYGEERLDALTVVALDDDNHPLSIELVETGGSDGYERSVIARADHISTLLSGVFDIQSIEKGEGVIALDFASADDTNVPPRGTFEARNLRIVDAPLLARIFAAGSLGGLTDLMNGDGIKLSQAFADFEINDGRVTLKDARAAGESIGITGNGSFDLGGGQGRQVDLHGAVAPAYQINSFLGKTPLIGDLFVNRDGEGLFALSYDIKGETQNPTVYVNPLSALTPGLFRRMFEPAENAETFEGEASADSNLPNDNLE